MSNNLLSPAPRKILIRSTNWIGDAIMTTPAIRSIRANFPDAHIAILVKPWVADVFTASPYLDEVIRYEAKGEHRGLTGLWRLAQQLRAYKFDLAILLQNAFEAAFLTLLAGIPLRAGYKRDGRQLLLSHPVAIDREVRKLHQVHYYQGLLQGLGLALGSNELFLAIAPAALAAGRQRLADRPQGPVVGLNPGAAYGPAKRWPAEKYGQLAARLQAELGATILIFGTVADQEAAGVIKNSTSGHTLDLTGHTTLAEAIALISLCDYFVTNDSGLMHVGAALATPLAAIFGSTDAVATGPFAANATVIQKNLPCGPCLKPDCAKDFRCMLEISVDEVFQTAKDSLRRPPFCKKVEQKL